MRFKFDWEDVVRGTIEIDAKNGSEAEMIFTQMSSTERQGKSSIFQDEDNAKIKFVDFEWADTLTYEEWKSDWDLTVEEWEEWEKRHNQSSKNYKSFEQVDKKLNCFFNQVLNHFYLCQNVHCNLNRQIK